MIKKLKSEPQSPRVGFLSAKSRVGIFKCRKSKTPEVDFEIDEVRGSNPRQMVLKLGLEGANRGSPN